MARMFLLFSIAVLLSTGTYNVTSFSTVTPIQHIIIIMQENHSFDNYFGTYPTANGTVLESTTSRLQHVNGIPNHTCIPYGSSCISPQFTSSSNPQNPNEGQVTYEMDYSNDGTGFPNYSGPQSMIYFDYHSVAGYWDYAEEYGIGDNYFAAVLGMTTPNRLMLLGGDSSTLDNSAPPPYLPYTQTLMHQLDGAGVSWGYFDYIDNNNGPSNVYPFNYISGVTSPQTNNKIGTISTLFQYLSQGTGLPSVNFVNSLGRPEVDEHPSSDPTSGELWVISVINQVMRSSYWPTTAIFLTWDEGGGYYDHVIPPSNFTIDHDFMKPLIGLGQRVPLIVVSPYARENFVSHDQLSHLSLLHLVEYNWKLSPLNNLVAQSNLPLSFFNFSQPERTPLILGPIPTYPLPLQSSEGDSLTPLSISITVISIASIAVVLVVLMKRMKILGSTEIARDQSMTIVSRKPSCRTDRQ